MYSLNFKNNIWCGQIQKWWEFLCWITSGVPYLRGDLYFNQLLTQVQKWIMWFKWISKFLNVFLSDTKSKIIEAGSRDSGFLLSVEEIKHGLTTQSLRHLPVRTHLLSEKCVLLLCQRHSKYWFTIMPKTCHHGKWNGEP